jgi:exonuclease III
MMKCSLASLLVIALTLFAFLCSTIQADTECPKVSSIEDRRKDKTKLRLMQYNVEWLFIDHSSYTDCPGNSCTWKNVSEAQTHLNTVSKVLVDLNPDIINFCEVEGCDELNMLRDTLDGSYRAYLRQGTDTGTGQNVGMMTRVDPSVDLYRTENKYSYPIAGSKCGYTGTGSTGVSKHYITEFNINNMKIAMVSAHLIAIPTDPQRCAQREGQATVLQSVIANYVSQGYEVIMLGDFNDYDNQVLDINNHVPLSQAVAILKGQTGANAGKYSLSAVSAAIPQTERYSDWYDSDNNCQTSSISDYSMIDHILVTPGLQGKIVNTFIYHGYQEYCGKYDSDHYPMVVDMEF